MAPLRELTYREVTRRLGKLGFRSPAATASLSIGEFIAGKVAERF